MADETKQGKKQDKRKPEKIGASPQGKGIEMKEDVTSILLNLITTSTLPYYQKGNHFKRGVQYSVDLIPTQCREATSSP